MRNPVTRIEVIADVPPTEYTRDSLRAALRQPTNDRVAFYQLGDVRRSWEDVKAFEARTGERHPFRDQVLQRLRGAPAD